MHPETPDAVRLAVAKVALEIRSHAEAISLAYGERREEIDHAIRTALAPPRGIAKADPETDKRAATWLCRFRIYSDRDGFTEPEADSDDDLDPGAPGTTLIKGLRAVGDYAVQLAAAYHDNPGPLAGLSGEALDKKVAGLRPTLSRRGGNATWRLYYNTPRSIQPSNPRHFAYLIRIDLERAEAGSGNFNRTTDPTHEPLAETPRAAFGNHALSQRDPG